MAFGSGVVKVTPAHDPNDYAVYTRHLGSPTEIAVLNLMTPDGRVNDADPSWAAYAGLTFNAARKKIVEDLIAGGFMTEADIKTPRGQRQLLRPQQDRHPAVPVRSVVREDGPPGRAGPGGGARRHDQVLSPSGTPSSI